VRSHAGEIRKAIQEHVPAIVAKLAETAKAGDVAAASSLLDRAVPKLRPTAAAVCIDLSGSATDVGQRLLEAVGRGELPIDIASELAALAARATSTTETIKPVDYEALDRFYEEKVREAFERDAEFRTRRAEELRAMGDPDYQSILQGANP
jgi:hypothetical protein